MWTIGDHATRDVVTVNGSWTAQQCGDLLQKLGVRHLPLVDDSGRPRAMVSDARIYGLIRRDLYDVHVRSVAIDPPLLLHRRTSLNEALTRMVTGGVDAALVIDDDACLVGIFTEHDALKLAELSLRPWLTVKQVALPNLDLYTVSLGTTFDEARELMTTLGLRHLVVTDDEGRLAGVVSFRDVAGRERTTVDKRLHSPVRTVRFDDDLHGAVSRMVREKIGVLPVVDDSGLPQAVLTRVDVIRALQQQLTDSDRDDADAGEIAQSRGPEHPGHGPLKAPTL